MSKEERAKVVAIARLAGVAGTDKEIIDRYTAYYQTALKSLSAPAEVEIIGRPW